MKQNLAKFIGSSTRFLRDPHNQKILAISSFIILFSCLLFLLFGRAPRQRDALSVEGRTLTPLSQIPTTTPTKWWIKVTSTSSPTSLSTSELMDAEGFSTSGCRLSSSSSLKPGIYAYISLTPPEPNRIRSGAGKRYAYLGQIEPGAGVKILAGPLCADSFSWWLVDSTQGELRGWTAEGIELQQWLIPCPDQMVTCYKTPSSTPTLPASKDSTKSKDNECKSEKLSIGILAQVEQGSLLVIRSEPGTGDVVERVGPLSMVNILGGPVCSSGTVWWNVESISQNFAGWATEDSLISCSKEAFCKRQ